MAPQNIIVTGGTGMVGRNLRAHMPDATFMSSAIYDLTCANDVESLFDAHWGMDDLRIIHCAAKVGGLEHNMLYQYDYWEDNCLMNTLLLKYARIIEVKRFTAILSTCIFPSVATHYPMTENMMHDSAPSPSNYGYAIAKRALASGIDCCNQQYGTKYNYLIPCNLYGKFDKTGDNSHYVAALIKKIHQAVVNDDKHITLMGDGTPLRQFLLADDFARIIKMMVDEDITESFNVANDELYSIHEIALIALEALGCSHLTIKYENPNLIGQHRKDADTTKFKSLFPDFKFVSLHEGIKQAHEHYKTTLK